MGIAALCFAQPTQTTLTNDSIITMVKAKLGEDVVINAIQAQPAKYSTGADDVIALKAAGVSDKIITAMIAKVSHSAPSATLPEPELRDTVYWLDRGNNKLISLERQTAHIGGTAPIPFAPVKGKFEINGNRSPVRFPADSKPEFVFSAAQNVDPQSLAQIFTLTVKKEHRELMVSKITPFRGPRTHEQDKKSVSFQASKHNESSIRITPTMPLPPGEYGILRGREMFCFGVN